MEFYDLYVETAQGEKISMRTYEGKVVLVVNTATGCGFTPQYEVLEQMYEKYHAQGLEIIDVPCNQFYGQAPGSDEEITQFCQLHFNTKFPQMKKSDVNGENAIDLYKWLTANTKFEGFDDNDMGRMLGQLLEQYDPEFHTSSAIKWNFTKFLIDREGNIVERFEPTNMKELEEKIKACL